MIAILLLPVSASADMTLLDTTFIGWGQVPGGPPSATACIAIPTGTQTIQASAAVTKPDTDSPATAISLTIGTTDPPQVVDAPLNPAAPVQWAIDVSAGAWPLCWTLDGSLPLGTPFAGQDAHEFNVHLTVRAVGS
jgi:hypothetical protein